MHWPPRRAKSLLGHEFGLETASAESRPAMSDPSPRSPRAFDLDALARGVRAGDRAALGRAITLVESQRADHRDLADALLTEVMPSTGGAVRVGVTGVPGAGKSTFIEALGCRLVEAGNRVAVLAVDPTSSRSRGSILGDKTRMTELARTDNAFVRPSPSGDTAGGVAGRTREAMLVLEAAGFDVVLIETVGVGQTETLVAQMVDFVLLLALAGAGDELQGIKRGILEWVDLVCIHKADGDGLDMAQRARAELASAMRYVRPVDAGWRPPVLCASAVTGTGLDEVWQKVVEHREQLGRSGRLEAKRQRQQVDWLWTLVEDDLRRAFRHHPGVAAALPASVEDVRHGRVTPTAAARHLLATFAASDSSHSER